MGDSLHSVGAWIGVISFFAAVIAVANKQIQSPIVWLCLGLWVMIVLFYCLAKLIGAIVSMQIRSTGHHRESKRSFQRKGLDSKENRASDDNVLQQILKSKNVSFKLPSLAGFTPDRFQVPASRNAFQESSPSKGFALGQQQKAKSQDADFKLPSLAGFAPHNLRKPTTKNPRQ